MSGSRTLALAALFTCALLAPAMAQDRPTLIRQSYLEAFGKAASNDEVNYWNGRQDWTTLGQLINMHMPYLKGNPEMQESNVRAAYAAAGLAVPSDALLHFWKADLARTPQKVSVLSGVIRAFTNKREQLIKESYRNAMGLEGNADQVKYWQTRADWFGLNGIQALHRAYIAGNDSVAAEVVHQSYRNVFGRPADQNQLNYWVPFVKRGVLCIEVEASHREWFDKQMKQMLANPQLMAKVAAAGAAFDDHGNLVSLPRGGPAPAPAPAVTTPNGQQLGSSTGGGIVAAGAGNASGGLLGKGGAGIVSAGAGNASGGVLAPAGTYLIGHDGSTLIGHDGSTLIGHDGSTAVPR